MKKHHEPNEQSDSTSQESPDAAESSMVAIINDSGLSTELREAAKSARRYMKASVADNTKRAYTSDWSMFTKWCDRMMLQKLPATPRTVSMYASALADGTAFPDEKKKIGPRAVSTIERHLASISVAHRVAHEESPLESEEVQRTLDGIRRTHGTRPNKKRPFTAELIEKMSQRVNFSEESELNKEAAIRDIAILLIGFGGAFRRSEIVSLDIEDLEFNPKGVTVLLRRSKTDQTGKGREVKVSAARKSDMCPVKSLQAWLAVLSNRGITTGPLFCSLSRNNMWGRLGDAKVAKIVKSFAAVLGEKAKLYSGHSLRSGHITSAARAGKRVDAIQDTTGHAHLDTLMGYIDREGAWEDTSGDGLL